MKNPNLVGRGLLLSFFACNLLFFSITQAQSISLDIEFEDTVCILNNDPTCKGFVLIQVNPIGFCSDVSVSHNSNYAYENSDPSGVYPAGFHEIEITAEDGCGNVLSDLIGFSVIDCRTPTAICSYGHSFELDDSCTLTIQAEELNAGSSDNCSSQNELNLEIARIDGNGNLFNRGQSISLDSSLTGNQALAFIVTDQAGNEEVCTTVVQVSCGQCPKECTPDTSTGNRRIYGAFFTLSGEELDSVNLSIGSTDIGMFDSPYQVDSLPFQVLIGSTYLCAEKNNNYLNGVSTMDLVRIRRAILQLDTFDVLQNIAADVNNDERVSTRDMIEIRQLILKQNEAFSQVPSWRMFPLNFDFSTLQNEPWADPFTFQNQCYEIAFPMERAYNGSFKGLKMGDVTGDGMGRAAKPLIIQSTDQSFSVGETIVAPFNFMSDELLGYQLTVSFDPDVLEFIGTDGALEQIHVNLMYLEDGLIPISKVIDDTAKKTDFALRFLAKSQGTLSHSVLINSEITSAEAYIDLNHIYDLKLEFSNYSNPTISVYPNPFADQVNISLHVEKSGEYKAELIDIHGRVLSCSTHYLDSGDQELNLDLSEGSPSEGLHIVRIKGVDLQYTAFLRRI